MEMHNFSAHYLCKGSVHVYCARHGHYSSLRTGYLGLGRDRYRAASRRRRRQGPRPPPAPALAGLLGTNPGATSYHLRRLETVGLVADTGTGKGKERVWQAAVEQHSWTPRELVDHEDPTTALTGLGGRYLRHFASKAEHWLDVQQDWPVEWVDHLGINDNVALVTLEQLRAMRREIEEVLQKYRRLGQGNPQAKRIAVYTYAYPV